MDSPSGTLIIACGALAHEIAALRKANGWAFDVRQNGLGATLSPLPGDPRPRAAMRAGCGSSNSYLAD